MTQQSIKDLTLPQVPDLQLAIITCRQQVGAMWMKVDTVNQVIMRIIMLQKSVTSVIEDLDLPIGST